MPMNTANKLTLLRVFLIPVFLVVAYWGFPGSRYVALAIYIVACLTDLLDGYIARHYNQVSDFGKFAENLTARPMLWLWTLRDVAWIGTGLLLSVLALTQTGSMIPLVITAALAFLCIRHGGISMLDFLRYAAAFFFFGQQYYVWRESA